MSTSGKPEIVERGVKDREDKKDDKDEGFIDKVKDFIHDIGEKIEEAIGFGKPSADSDGRKLVSGLIPDAGTIHAHGEETVKIPVHLIFDDIKSTYDDIKPGSIIPYKVKVDLIVDVPIFGRLTLPLEKTGEIPIPYKPDIDLEKIRFERFSFEETVAVLHLKLENKNDFDLGLNALDYEPKDFGSALWDMIRGRGTGYTMKGNIDVDTPFGAMKLPISREGGTTRLKKKKEDRDYDDDDDDDED
ncbi:Late embryogenesis abundant protein Lea14 [Quillaja saponaria]|uniref:Late embryogenesis abundant protein Lea14 n=1 Tax=Quillaja saponaria TaxID=32244 RepID=A0AAD7LNE6_QUISA|nr:Late embryogenesis abundant protein Lea14 [Quillaja saponaria]